MGSSTGEGEGKNGACRGGRREVRTWGFGKDTTALLLVLLVLLLLLLLLQLAAAAAVPPPPPTTIYCR